MRLRLRLVLLAVVVVVIVDDVDFADVVILEDNDLV